MGIEIVRISPDCVSHESHREDFETCPDCGHKKETNDWFSLKYPIVISLDTGGYSLYSRAIVVSECDECYEKSWVHLNLTSLFYQIDLSDKQKDIISKEIARRKLSGIREFQKSLCCKCINLKSLTFDNYRCCMSCKFGSGSCEKKCKNFKSI